MPDKSGVGIFHTKKTLQTEFARSILFVIFKLLLKSSLSREGKFHGFLPVFSVKIPFEKAQEFRKAGGQYVRYNQYNEMTADVYL